MSSVLTAPVQGRCGFSSKRRSPGRSLQRVRGGGWKRRCGGLGPPGAAPRRTAVRTGIRKPFSCWNPRSPNWKPVKRGCCVLGCRRAEQLRAGCPSQVFLLDSRVPCLGPLGPCFPDNPQGCLWRQQLSNKEMSIPEWAQSRRPSAQRLEGEGGKE